MNKHATLSMAGPSSDKLPAICDLNGAKLREAIAEAEADYQKQTQADAQDLDSHVETEAKEIDRLKAHTVKTIIDIGKHLDIVHTLLSGAGRDGSFTPWVRGRCGFTARTAWNYLAAYRTFGKCETISHFSAMALYVLSGNSCPEDATAEAIERAANGEEITEKLAREIKAKHGSTTKEDDGGFDYRKERLRVAAFVRKCIKSCPPDHLTDLSQLLRQLADEAKTQ